MKLSLCVAFVFLFACGFSETYDYIVVGAGNTGSVLANRLSEDPFISVLVLERASDFVEPGPVKATEALRLTYSAGNIYDINEVYYTTPNYQNLGIKSKLKIGRGLGGSTLASSGEYSRPLNFDFDAWNLPGWSSTDVGKYFKLFENHDGSGDHGKSGPVRIRKPTSQTTEDAFLGLLSGVGFPVNDDGTDGLNSIGAYKSYYTLDDANKKVTAKTAYLQSIMSRPNLKIITNARVTKILVDKYSSPLIATGVIYSQSGSVIQVTARKEVILCAGPLETPKILELSGIGNSAILNEHNIPVISDNPNVGENLVTKPSVTMLFSGTTLLPEQNLTALQESSVVGQYLVGSGGLYVIPTASVQALIPISGVMTFVEYSSITNPFEALQTSHAISVSVADPLSRGSVHITNANAFLPPQVNTNLYGNQQDIVSMLTALGGLTSIIENGGAASFLGVSLATYTDTFVAMSQTKPFRQSSGSCKMGVDSTSAVTPDLRVNNFVNLRVVDASVFPQPIKTGHTAVLYMLGEKASQMIKDDDYAINIDYDRGYSICEQIHGHSIIFNAKGGDSSVCDETKSRGINLLASSVCESTEAASVMNVCGPSKVWLKPVNGVCRTLNKLDQSITIEDCSMTYPTICKI